MFEQIIALAFVVLLFGITPLKLGSVFAFGVITIRNLHEDNLNELFLKSYLLQMVFTIFTGFYFYFCLEVWRLTPEDMSKAAKLYMTICVLVAPGFFFLISLCWNLLINHHQQQKREEDK